MPELIDRQAALKKMCETCGYCEKFEKSMRSTHPDFVVDKCIAYKFLVEQPTVEAEPVYEKILVELDHYYSTRKQICYPIGYPNMLIHAVHCAVNGSYEEALDAIERIRKGRVASGKELEGEQN